MHELSLAHRILDQALEVAKRNRSLSLARVCLEVGPLSGVEPLLLQSAFEQATSERLSDRVELEIDQVALQVRCKSCGCNSNVEDFVFQCATCRSQDLEVIAGEAVRLMSVDLCEREHVQ